MKPRQHVPFAPAPWLALVAVVLLAPAPADAQFWKKIKEAATEAVKEEVTAHTGDPEAAPQDTQAQPEGESVTCASNDPQCLQEPASSPYTETGAHPQKAGILAKINALPPDLRDTYLAESERNRQSCLDNVSIGRYHNCDCYGVEYLRARYEQPGDLREIGFVRDVNYGTCISKSKVASQFNQMCLDEPWSGSATHGAGPSAAEDPLERWRRIQEERQKQQAAKYGEGTSSSAPTPGPEQQAFCQCVGSRASDDFHTLRNRYLKDIKWLYQRSADQCRGP